MLDAIFSFDTLWIFLMILYVPACIGLIVVVLLQKGKGTGFAGAFGAGAGPGADAVFGPKSGQTLPVRLTYFAAITFMVIAVIMSIIAGRVGKGVAPELLEVSESDSGYADTFDSLGIGTGNAGAAQQTSAAGDTTTDTPVDTTDAASEPKSISISIDASGSAVSNEIVITPEGEAQEPESSGSPQ